MYAPLARRRRRIAPRTYYSTGNLIPRCGEVDGAMEESGRVDEFSSAIKICMSVWVALEVVGLSCACAAAPVTVGRARSRFDI